MPRCLHCKEKFVKKYPNQQGKLRYCLENDECTKVFWEKAKELKWKKDKKELKEKLKTLQDHVLELQKIFNKWIRLSKEPTCISCGKDLRGRKFDAGHYRAAGNVPPLRFEPDNVWPQCVYCNQHLSANLVEYRLRLIKKIGLERVEELEKYQESKNWTIPEIKQMKEDYKKKIKDLLK